MVQSLSLLSTRPGIPCIVSSPEKSRYPWTVTIRADGTGQQARDRRRDDQLLETLGISSSGDAPRRFAQNVARTHVRYLQDPN